MIYNKSDYFKKLKDPRWQRKRLEIFERDGFKCLSCLSTTNQLHVHHLYYEPGKEPWESNDKYLMTLCSDCHELVTNENKVLNPLLIEKVLGTLRDGFTKQCAIEVFEAYDMDNLIFTLWDAKYDIRNLSEYFQSSQSDFFDAIKIRKDTDVS